jgi:hypothetical protein
MRRASVVVTALAAVLACNGASKETTPRPVGSGDDVRGSATVTMTPDSPGSFVRGAALVPADQLIAWLDGQKRGDEPRLIRLPVVLARRGPKFSTVGARVGGAPDGLAVFLDDAKLGIGLADRARTACNDASATTCALWVEGYWRGERDGDYTFEVMAVRDPIAPDQLAGASHAEVQGESGN